MNNTLHISHGLQLSLDAITNVFAFLGRVTEAGFCALGTFQPLPVGSALSDYWMGRLPGPEKEILRVLVELNRQPVTKEEELASRTTNSRGAPYEPNGGAFANPLSKLRTLGLVRGGSSGIVAADELFD